MDEEKDELHQFSVALFDKYGMARPWLIQASHRNGTGCWGREVNSGELIYLLNVDVNDYVSVDSTTRILRYQPCGTQLDGKGIGS